MNKNFIIKVLDFTNKPWPRYKSQGNNSWEEFFESILSPFFDKIHDGDYKKVVIDLDWTKWYPSSFLSESFWRLYQKLDSETKWNKIEFISNDDLSWIDFIQRKAPKYGK